MLRLSFVRHPPQFRFLFLSAPRPAQEQMDFFQLPNWERGKLILFKPKTTGGKDLFIEGPLASS
jgi:hypothetical protein